MNLTIPIRAQSSTASWSRQLRGISSRKYRSAERKRFIFSILTALLLVSTLIVGSVGGLLQGASAKDNFNRGPYYYNGSNDSSNSNRHRSPNPSNNTNTNKNTDTSAPTKTTTPAKTTPITPTTQTTQTPAQQPSTPPAAAPVVTQKPQVVSQSAVVETPKPVDTAPEIATMTTAQAAETTTQPVSYTSNQLSEESRNRIFIMAGIATLTGALLYTISFFGTVPVGLKREIPIRYIIPIKEGVTS